MWRACAAEAWMRKGRDKRWYTNSRDTGEIQITTYAFITICKQSEIGSFVYYKIAKVDVRMKDII